MLLRDGGGVFYQDPVGREYMLQRRVPLSSCSLLLFLGVFAASASSSAQVYGPSVKEFKFEVSPHFVTTSNDPGVWEQQARLQMNHLFGVLNSPGIIRRYKLDSHDVPGVGAPLLPLSLSKFRAIPREEGKTLVSYVARGKILLHNNVAAQAATENDSLSYPLPLDVETFYDENCTDPLHSGQSDFWYFYDAFRTGCRHLARLPLASRFVFRLSPSSRRELDMDLRLDLLRGANGNGALFRIDVIHGFDQSDRDPKDGGRTNFNSFQDWLKSKGFAVESAETHWRQKLKIWKKSIRPPSGKVVEVEVRSLLVDTGTETRSHSFAQFFRESVRDADVIVYAGHSGLGDNLDIPALEKRAGGFEFARGKRQVFFFDSCSSYSYFLNPFRAAKSKTRIDVVTNGVASFFETGEQVLASFLGPLINPEVTQLRWDQFLTQIESTLDGGSYLINVGGI